MRNTCPGEKNRRPVLVGRDHHVLHNLVRHDFVSCLPARPALCQLATSGLEVHPRDP